MEINVGLLRSRRVDRQDCSRRWWRWRSHLRGQRPLARESCTARGRLRRLAVCWHAAYADRERRRLPPGDSMRQSKPRSARQVALPAASSLARHGALPWRGERRALDFDGRDDATCRVLRPKRRSSGTAQTFARRLGSDAAMTIELLAAKTLAPNGGHRRLRTSKTAPLRTARVRCSADYFRQARRVHSARRGVSVRCFAASGDALSP